MVRIGRGRLDFSNEVARQTCLACLLVPAFSARQPLRCRRLCLHQAYVHPTATLPRLRCPLFLLTIVATCRARALTVPRRPIAWRKRDSAMRSRWPSELMDFWAARPSLRAALACFAI